MEFRCRLATARGEVIEDVYVSESEERLRHELEEKGLFVLSLRRRGGMPGLVLAPTRRRKIARQEFLVFNQELATLLKAGMPLVQSLDILRQRVSNATLKAILDDVHGKVRAGSASLMRRSTSPTTRRSSPPASRSSASTTAASARARATEVS